MGVDTRVGMRDYHVRYRIYKPDLNVNDKISISNNFVGILHAKDITPYNQSADIIGDKHMRDLTRATIETQDKITLAPNYFLQCIADGNWYIIENVAPNSHNETQRYSSRPVITTQIVIRRGA